MRIDEKYFVPFIIIVAGVTALIIVYFTISNQSSKNQAFTQRIMAQDSLKYQYMPLLDGKDSLSVQSFPHAYVVLDFWATWTSSFTKKAHQQLNMLKKMYPRRLQVLAAVVRDKPERVKEYINRYHYPFHYVNGSKVFGEFHVPGVPTQLVYAPGGRLKSIFTGYADSVRLDSLKSLIGGGK